MSIPGDPSVQDIILQGMREGGQYTVTAGSTAYTDFKNYQWDTIKAEIWNACRTDKLLETTSVLLCNVGNSSVALPSDFDTAVSLLIYDASGTYRGTAQTGSSSSITLDSTFSAATSDLQGRYVFTLSGTGAGQINQITDYNDTTKVVTLASTWTSPDNTTTYLISSVHYTLHRNDYYRSDIPNRRPMYYGLTGYGLSVAPAGDLIYPIVLTYRSNLTRLDEAGSLLSKHLRERRHLWIQGVKTKTMARYDDDRYTTEKQIWEQMLRQYSAQSTVYTRMTPSR